MGHAVDREPRSELICGYFGRPPARVSAGRCPTALKLAARASGHLRQRCDDDLVLRRLGGGFAERNAIDAGRNDPTGLYLCRDRIAAGGRAMALWLLSTAPRGSLLRWYILRRHVEAIRR